jgi:hypothetical protein
MANNIRHDKVTRLSSRVDSRHGRRVFSEKLGSRHQTTINNLTNWRYFNPIFLFQGYYDMHDDGVFYAIMDNKIRRDSTYPNRRLAILTDRYGYDDAFTNKKLTYIEETAGTEWDCVNISQSLQAETPFFNEGCTTFPEAYTSGENTTTSAWEPLEHVPTLGYTKARVKFQNMRLMGLGLYEIPVPVSDLTALQMGCQAKDVDHNRLIKGSDGTRLGTSYGALWDYIGQRGTNVETVESMTRRNWQYCHPRGIYVDSTTTTATNIFNGLAVKVRPRQIINDSRKVKYDCVAVAEGDSFNLRFRNVVSGSVTVTNQTYALPTVIYLGALEIERGTDSGVVIEAWNNTGGNACLINSVAMFERDPWDTTA